MVITYAGSLLGSMENQNSIPVVSFNATEIDYCEINFKLIHLFPEGNIYFL